MSAIDIVETTQDFENEFALESYHSEIRSAFTEAGIELSHESIAMEGLRDRARSLWNTIMRFLRKIWNAIKSFFDAFLGSTMRIKARIAAVRTEAAKLVKAEPKQATIQMGSSWFYTYRRTDAVNGKMALDTLNEEKKVLNAFLINYTKRIIGVGEKLAKVIEDNSEGFTNINVLTATLGGVLQNSADDYYENMPNSPATKDPRFPDRNDYKSFEIGGRKAIRLHYPIDLSNPNGALIERLSDTSKDQASFLAKVQAIRYSLINYDSANRAPTDTVKVKVMTSKEIIDLCDMSLEITKVIDSYTREHLKTVRRITDRLEYACDKLSYKTDESGAINRQALVFVTAFSYWGTSLQTDLIKHASSVIRSAMLGCDASIKAYA